MTVLLRWTLRIHKWLALVVGIQIVLWIAGGVVMSALPLDRVRGEHNIAEFTAPALDVSGVLPVQAALSDLALGGALEAIDLRVWQGRVVYRVTELSGASVLVDAETGERLTPISREMAIEIASADHADRPEIAAVRFFDEPSWEYRRSGSAWRIDFADGEGTRIYVSPETGMVTARRNDTWRVFDFFWMLHIMDYEERENFNNPLLITASVFALVTVLAGLLLLVLRLQRLVRMELARRR
ncbi:PepSY domain-containing protein [Maricaulis maris]|jgi:hypothetical protein|uniref:PepSY domain-containing protein n=1 Tax=Maricaulis maris TaxID=74318 RepID=UPI0026EC08CE|nr:PepSY domain-containing protein [Maricaulis maris]